MIENLEGAVACLWQAAQDGGLSSARHGADRQGGTRACSARRAAGLAGPAGVRGGARGKSTLQVVHAAGRAARGRAADVSVGAGHQSLHDFV